MLDGIAIGAGRLHAPASRRAGAAAATFALGAAGACVILLWRNGGLSAPGALALNAMAATVYGLLRRALDGGWSGAVLARVALAAIAGPLGALGVVAAALLDLTPSAAGVAPRAHGALRKPPRPSRAERVWRDIGQGRRPRPLAGAVRPLSKVFAGDDPAEQSRSLAAIARDYRPEFAAALAQALEARDPAVRIQAAAVSAALRDRFAAEARGLLDAPPATLDPADAAARCRAVLASGFVEGDAAAALSARLLLLRARVVSGATAERAAPRISAPARPRRPKAVTS